MSTIFQAIYSLQSSPLKVDPLSFGCLQSTRLQGHIAGKIYLNTFSLTVPVTHFAHFFDESMIETLVQHTNKCTKQYLSEDEKPYVCT